jgi:hypothetical protein
MRQGGVAAKLTLNNNQIVNGANTITAINTVAITGNVTTQNPDYRFASTPANNAAITITGTLAGVKGTVTGQGSGGPPSTSNSYSFTPDTDPGTVACPAGTQLIIPPVAFDTISVIWAGRNNYSAGAQVKADIAAMVASLPNSRFVILSVLNGDYSTFEYSGLTGWTWITTLNADLKALYPDNFIDIRTILVGKGAPGQAYADATFYPLDVIPAALRYDAVHLNTAGYGIVAAEVAAFIATKGW